ncbi:hypothetical protein D3C78_1887490 [compost metagenome]
MQAILVGQQGLVVDEAHRLGQARNGGECFAGGRAPQAEGVAAQQVVEGGVGHGRGG